ncbi:alpha/beta hydrolase [Actinoallomurus sp. NBC_01490]
MNPTFKASAVVALCCAVTGTGLVGCKNVSDADTKSSVTSVARKAADGLLSGTRKIKIDGRSVNVSCSGNPMNRKPVIVLLAGLGDGLEKMAGLQKTLSENNRVCSYDRLGEGASDQPEGPQTFADTGKILTGVIDRVAGHRPVVLAAHSLGGMIAARYAPAHRDKVKGLVLMDATSPTSVADLTNAIPESATGPAAELHEQTLQVDQGNNPEKLVITDGKVRSAGNIPAAVIQHGKKYLAAAVPEYGPRLEEDWAKGQREWLAISRRSKLITATNSEHYIYLDQPELAVKTIQRVTSQAAR